MEAVFGGWIGCDYLYLGDVVELTENAAPPFSASP
jgi:hypothetical protein